MTAIHGKNAIIYLSPGSGAAVPISEQQQYSIEANFETVSTAELGDVWDGAVKGLHKWTGTLQGNFDTASNNLWNAMLSSTPNNFYLYPDRSAPTRYYYGTAWITLDTVIAGGVTDKANSSVQLVGDGTLSIN
jgi:hypothetical protein